MMNLGVIGCGRMAYALVKGISTKKNSCFQAIYACDSNSERSDLFKDEFAAIPITKEELISNSDLVLIAVKPAQVKDVLHNSSQLWTEDKLLMSIAAGIKCSFIEEELNKKIPVVRVMPNTPCLNGEGVSAVASGSFASDENLRLVQNIVASVGSSILVSEDYMDAITAVSGSGPAYAFLVLEAMIDAAVQVGLSMDMARQIVLQTFKGSIAMLEESGEHPAVLKGQVCSPAGTTIAAVRKLEESGIRKGFFDAIEAAYLRSIELGKRN